MRRLLPVAVALVLAVGDPVGTRAQESTPVAFPMTPDPSECAVEPRSVDDVAAFLATPVAAPASVLGPTAVTIPLGEPADAATVAAVTDTLRTALACFNAGDFLGVLSLVTDDNLRRLQALGILSPEGLAFIAAEPVPAPPEQRFTLLAVTDVSILPDGRVGAFGVQIDPTTPPEGTDVDYVVLAQVGGRWLIDETVDAWWVMRAPEAGTPTP